MTCHRGCCPTSGEHYRSLVMSGPVTKTWEDTTLGADRDAYKRMRDDGLQPKGVKGASFFEKHASSKWEVEAGRILPPSDAKRVDEANKEATAIMSGQG